MKIRELEEKDAGLMLEWMHDINVTEKLQGAFASKSIEDCNKFISGAKANKDSIHLACADDSDEYLGTVSLKNIVRFNDHHEDDYAEFAIAMRSKAMGTGAAAWAMKAIIVEGHEKYHVPNIYWCVREDNQRAVRFYDKNGYKRIDEMCIPAEMRESYKELDHLLWYMDGEENER